MNSTTRPVCIVAGKRIPFARSFTNYMEKTNQELLTKAVAELVNELDLKGEVIGEFVGGAVLKHSSDWNFSREVLLGSGLSAETPAYDVVQACGTSLQGTIAVANKIALGQIECGIASGVDTNSDIPFVFSRNFNHQMLRANKEKTLTGRLKQFLKIHPRDLKPQAPGVVEPRTGLSMGESCELMAKEWGITREAQDQLAYESHQKAALGYKEGFHQRMLTSFNGLDKDNNVRSDTSIEKLSKLKPVFDKSGSGTLTAGNSSTLSDGAACVFLCSEDYAKKNNLPVLAYLKDAETSAVDFVGAEGLLMAPTYAVSRLLERNQLQFKDFDFFEIHEAFAAQVLCTLKAWESKEFCKNKLGRSVPLGPIDRSKMNVKGGSVALGHPFAATGARIVTSLAHILNDHQGGRGLISICTGGGMGVTAILEK
jgi:acetyl-CoA C-acetyltransferase